MHRVLSGHLLWKHSHVWCGLCAHAICGLTLPKVSFGGWTVVYPKNLESRDSRITIYAKLSKIGRHITNLPANINNNFVLLLANAAFAPKLKINKQQFGLLSQFIAFCRRAVPKRYTRHSAALYIVRAWRRIMYSSRFSKNTLLIVDEHVGRRRQRFTLFFLLGERQFAPRPTLKCGVGYAYSHIYMQRRKCVANVVVVGSWELAKSGS